METITSLFCQENRNKNEIEIEATLVAKTPFHEWSSEEDDKGYYGSWSHKAYLAFKKSDTEKSEPLVFRTNSWYPANGYSAVIEDEFVISLSDFMKEITK